MSRAYVAPVEFNIYAAAQAGADIGAAFDALAAGEALVLDLSAIAEFDAAGLQLLVTTALAESRGGHRVEFTGVPGIVRRRFAELGIEHHLGHAAYTTEAA